MIDINSLPAEGFKGEFYKLNFQRLGFLLFPTPELNLLSYFSKSTQNILGKLNVHFNLTSIIKFPEFFKDVNYILLTEYSEMLFLPFLTNILPHVSIIASNLTYQLGRISLQAFHETLTDFDATSQQLNFFQESEIFDKYQEKMEISLQNWRKIYTAQDIKNCLQKVTQVNYYQIYNTQRGVWARCFPSGKNNGSCFWQLKNNQTNQKILLINQMAQFNWKTCQSYSIQRLLQCQKQDPYNLVIFTRKAFDTFSGNQQTKMGETIGRINNNASLGISTTIILEDNTLCIDLIPRLSLQPQGQLMGIILGHHSYHSFHNFINSYVDYLSKYYKNQIFAQSPDYPLIYYSKLRNKGLLAVGCLQQLAVKRKLPLKEIILQSHPFVRFIRDYEYHLEVDETAQINQYVKHRIEKIKLGSNFGGQLFTQFMQAVNSNKYVCFSHNVFNIDYLQIGRCYNLSGNQKLPLHLIARNYEHKFRFQNFVLKDGELELYPMKIEYLQLPKNWSKTLSNEITAKGCTVIHEQPMKIQTQKSTISISQQMKIIVQSTSQQELVVIVKCLDTLVKKYELPRQG